MNDYNLILTIKNAKLRAIMQENGISSSAELSRLSGVSQGSICKIMNLKLSVYLNSGIVRECIQQLADALLVHPGELMPEAHWHQAMQRNTFVANVSDDDILSLRTNQSELDPCKVLEHLETERRDAFEDMLDAGDISSREKEVLRMRLQKGMTYIEIGKALEFQVTSVRVRQIEQRAVRKLQSISTLGDVVEAAGVYADKVRPGL